MKQVNADVSSDLHGQIDLSYLTDEELDAKIKELEEQLKQCDFPKSTH